MSTVVNILKVLYQKTLKTLMMFNIGMEAKEGTLPAFIKHHMNLQSH